MDFRRRLLLALILFGLAATSVPAAGSTLVALVYDPMRWSIPPEINAAILDLRAEGHEIRIVDIAAENGDGRRPAETAKLQEAARAHLPAALTFRTGGRVASGACPESRDEFERAIR